MADQNKNFLALLNGLVRQEYYAETEITDTFLKDQLFPDMPDDEYLRLLKKSKGLISSMAKTNMELNQTEAFLASQTKKREGAITEEQAKVFLKLWRNHRSKIQESLVQKCTWNNKLKNVSWRIDVKSRAKHIDHINAPTAIVELQLESREQPSANAVTPATEMVCFEMDEKGIGQMMQSLKDIEDQIEQYSQQNA